MALCVGSPCGIVIWLDASLELVDRLDNAACIVGPVSEHRPAVDVRMVPPQAQHWNLKAFDLQFHQLPESLALVDALCVIRCFEFMV